MKNVFSISTLARASKLFAAVACVAFVTGTAYAADAAAGSNDGKIAVVDLQYLVSNSKAGKSIRSQLDQQRKNYSGQIEKQEADLRAAEKTLVADQPKLSKEELQKRSTAFRDKVVAAQRSVQQRRVSFDKAYTAAMEKLREHIVKIVADIAGKNGIALVLNRQEVVLVDAKMDLTKQVIAALDAQVTSIPVSVK